VSPSFAAYRPRQPESTALYCALEAHVERYVQVHAERYEPRHGPLRSVVCRVVAQYLDCGRLKSGFARLRCPACRTDHLLAFSCQTRNFCPSCQAKRAALFAEHVREEVALPVPHTSPAVRGRRPMMSSRAGAGCESRG